MTRSSPRWITYLPEPELHTNAATSYAGVGYSPQESQENAQYWTNQRPWVRTVAFSKAPAWAIEEAYAALEQPCLACGKVHPHGEKNTICITPEGELTEQAKQWP